MAIKNSKLTADISIKLIKIIKIVLKEGYCSMQLIQERLDIGVNLASMIIDWLEENEIIAPFDGSKRRDVLYKRVGNLVKLNKSDVMRSDCDHDYKAHYIEATEFKCTKCGKLL